MLPITFITSSECSSSVHHRGIYGDSLLGATRVYDLALFSYLFALLHFGTELLVYRSVKIAAPIFSPVVVACKSHKPASMLCAHAATDVLTISVIADLDVHTVQFLREAMMISIYRPRRQKTRRPFTIFLGLFLGLVSMHITVPCDIG